jgi:hypothetical protein
MHSTLAAFPDWEGAKLLCASPGHVLVLVMRADLGAGAAMLASSRDAASWVEMGLRRLLTEAGIDLERDGVRSAPVLGASGTGVNFGLTAAKALKRWPDRRVLGERHGDFEECLRHRLADPSHPVRSVGEHSNPQGMKASAAGAVAETTQNDGASQESATPNRKRCAGPMCAAIGKLAFRVGRRVRISFAPAASQQQTGRLRTAGPPTL